MAAGGQTITAATCAWCDREFAAPDTATRHCGCRRDRASWARYAARKRASRELQAEGVLLPSLAQVEARRKAQSKAYDFDDVIDESEATA